MSDWTGKDADYRHITVTDGSIDELNGGADTIYIIAATRAGSRPGASNASIALLPHQAEALGVALIGRAQALRDNKDKQPEKTEEQASTGQSSTSSLSDLFKQFENVHHIIKLADKWVKEDAAKFK